MNPRLKLALCVSVGVHALAFISVSGFELASFDIDRGPSSIELYLGPVSEPKPPRLLEVSPDPPEPEVEKAAELSPSVPESSEPIAESLIAPEQRGAQMILLPDYLRNPPPVYPHLARQRGYEGTVVLEAYILTSGRCGQVEVLHSSGHTILDEAARQAVRQWIFKPARQWQRPVLFVVEIPITFRLTEQNALIR